jgi:uncharacterized protein
MKKRAVFFLSAFLFLSVITSAQEKTKAAYDSVLAQRLGGNDNGMKMYTLVILTTGKATITDQATRDSLFGGHMKNILSLAAEGKLVVAGPFEKNDLNYRGVFIFNTASVNESKALVASDPAVKAGIFDAIYLPWYCSAALMEVNNIHGKIQKPSL